jgi:hypothetical protein
MPTLLVAIFDPCYTPLNVRHPRIKVAELVEHFIHAFPVLDAFVLYVGHIEPYLV